MKRKMTGFNHNNGSQPNIYIKCNGLTGEEINSLLQGVDGIRKKRKKKKKKLSYIVDCRKGNIPSLNLILQDKAHRQ